MSLRNQSTQLLKLKCEILKFIIEENQEDPRVSEPIRQLKVIEKELESRERKTNEDEEGEPEDLVVGLKTLNLKSSLD